MSVRDAAAGFGVLVRAAMRSAKLLAVVARTAGEIADGRGDPREVNRSGARRVLRAMGVQLQVCGEVPPEGLIVCNHLSYLDIIAISAAAPAVFVAKSELRSWPIVGWIARRTGTIFAERGRPSSAGRTVKDIQGALRAGSRVVLFPEGTSSGGKTVLPFKSSLLEPGRSGPIWAAPWRTPSRPATVIRRRSSAIGRT